MKTTTTELHRVSDNHSLLASVDLDDPTPTARSFANATEQPHHAPPVTQQTKMTTTELFRMSDDHSLVASDHSSLASVDLNDPTTTAPSFANATEQPHYPPPATQQTRMTMTELRRVSDDHSSLASVDLNDPTTTAPSFANATELSLVPSPSPPLIPQKTKRGALVYKPVIMISPRPTDSDIYKDKEKVWPKEESAWGLPVRGENGIGRLVFDPEAKTTTPYIFCINHGWCAVGENPHTTSECKAFKRAVTEGKIFESSNPEVHFFLKNGVALSESLGVKKEPESYPGKAIKAPPRWYPKRNTLDMEENMETAKPTEVVNIENINGSKAKLGFGKFKNMRYNVVLASMPGYTAALLPNLSKDPLRYGPHANTFYRWLKYNKHVIPTNGDPHDDGTIKDKKKKSSRGGGTKQQGEEDKKKSSRGGGTKQKGVGEKMTASNSSKDKSKKNTLPTKKRSGKKNEEEMDDDEEEEMELLSSDDEVIHKVLHADENIDDANTSCRPRRSGNRPNYAGMSDEAFESVMANSVLPKKRKTTM